MQLKRSLPHTQAEMIANAPHGIVKIGQAALLQAVKNSTAAKINSCDNMPQPAVDIFEEAARKMDVATLGKTLKTYYAQDAEKCTEIGKIKRGEGICTPDSLISCSSYWKLNFEVPPQPTANIVLNATQRSAMKLSTIRL